MFNGLESLIDLQLGYVGLQQIPSGMWSELPSLQTLNLIGNDVRYIGLNTFKDSSNLRNLDLTANKLTTIRANTWMGLGNLRQLSLRINKITTVEPNGFAHLRNINLILMARNQLTAIQANVFNPEDFPQSGGHPTQLSLDISQNPLHCDRRMCWLKKAEEDGWKVPRRTHYYWGEPSCTNFPGLAWKDVTLNCVTLYWVRGLAVYLQ